ncbi:DUF445 domain-containing protein [Geobacter sulfurreducens]|uniref:DUF445 domain-containing protein n=1 Tax=Geobacter sulfurreducens TaxID=35554 RepID=UPI0020B7DDBB|nr:DUF445 family protein [Geobacter sulfurreducens]UTG93581.1 DUF445 family protein [Geobacter sulfurreducens]
MSLQSMLPYVTPPVVGAVIGYVTNDIAIRMLFRPLKPWRVFGMRVPLTPGVIPAGRHEFAATIGRMVGTHLVTGADVARALSKDSFRRELQEAVSGKLDTLLDRDLGTVDSLLPEGFESWLRHGADLAARRAGEAIAGYLQGDDFRRELSLLLRDLEERVLPRELERILAGETGDAVRDGAGRALAALLQSRGVSRAVAGLVDDKLDELLASERPLRELLPPELVELATAQVREAVPVILGRVAEFVRSPEIRDTFEVKLRAGVQQYLANLKGTLGFMAGFISVEKLNSYFPGLVGSVTDEVVRWLGEETTHRRVADMVDQGLGRILDRPLAATVEQLPYRRVALLRRSIRRGALGLVRRPETAGFLLAVAERELVRLAADPPRPILERLSPEDDPSRLRDGLARWLTDRLRDPGIRASLERIVAGRVEEWLFNRPLGRLSARISAEVRRDLDQLIYRQVADLLEREAPPLIDALDVARMVEEKINTLDILAVEGLLLAIMQKHFLYINLFGALLGFVMGAFNVLLMGLGR